MSSTASRYTELTLRTAQDHLADDVRRGLTYYPIDIAADSLRGAARGLLADYPALRVVGLAGEYADGLNHLAERPGPSRLVAFLGSTVGNFNEEELASFLGLLRGTLRPQ